MLCPEQEYKGNVRTNSMDVRAGVVVLLLIMLIVPPIYAAVGCIIKKADTEIFVTESYDPDSGQLIANAKLTYTDVETGKKVGLGQRELVFNVNYTTKEGENKFDSAKAQTNNLGKATASFVIPNAKEHKVEVIFKGDEGFKESVGTLTGGSGTEVSFKSNLPEGVDLVTCMPLLLLIGMLGAAMYASGRNPFGIVDFTAPRGFTVQRRVMKAFTAGGWGSWALAFTGGALSAIAGGLVSTKTEKGKEKGKEEEKKKAEEKVKEEGKEKKPEKGTAQKGEVPMTVKSNVPPKKEQQKKGEEQQKPAPNLEQPQVQKKPEGKATSLAPTKEKSEEKPTRVKMSEDAIRRLNIIAIFGSILAALGGNVYAFSMVKEEVVTETEITEITEIDETTDKQRVVRKPMILAGSFAGVVAQKMRGAVEEAVINQLAEKKTISEITADQNKTIKKGEIANEGAKEAIKKQELEQKKIEDGKNRVKSSIKDINKQIGDLKKKRIEAEKNGKKEEIEKLNKELKALETEKKKYEYVLNRIEKEEEKLKNVKDKIENERSLSGIKGLAGSGLEQNIDKNKDEKNNNEQFVESTVKPYFDKGKKDGILKGAFKDADIKNAEDISPEKLDKVISNLKEKAEQASPEEKERITKLIKETQEVRDGLFERNKESIKAMKELNNSINTMNSLLGLNLTKAQEELNKYLKSTFDEVKKDKILSQEFENTGINVKDISPEKLDEKLGNVISNLKEKAEQARSPEEKERITKAIEKTQEIRDGLNEKEKDVLEAGKYESTRKNELSFENIVKRIEHLSNTPPENIAYEDYQETKKRYEEYKEKKEKGEKDIKNLEEMGKLLDNINSGKPVDRETMDTAIKCLFNVHAPSTDTQLLTLLTLPELISAAEKSGNDEDVKKSKEEFAREINEQIKQINNEKDDVKRITRLGITLDSAKKVYGENDPQGKDLENRFLNEVNSGKQNVQDEVLLSTVITAWRQTHPGNDQTDKMLENLRADLNSKDPQKAEAARETLNDYASWLRYNLTPLSTLEEVATPEQAMPYINHLKGMYEKERKEEKYLENDFKNLYEIFGDKEIVIEKNKHPTYGEPPEEVIINSNPPKNIEDMIKDIENSSTYKALLPSEGELLPPRVEPTPSTTGEGTPIVTAEEIRKIYEMCKGELEENGVQKTAGPVAVFLIDTFIKELNQIREPEKKPPTLPTKGDQGLA